MRVYVVRNTMDAQVGAILNIQQNILRKNLKTDMTHLLTVRV